MISINYTQWTINKQSSIYQIAITLTFHLNAQQSLLRLRCCRIHRPFNKMQEHYCDCACLFTPDLNINDVELSIQYKETMTVCLNPFLNSIKLQQNHIVIKPVPISDGVIKQYP
jgi:hypothetical protein